MGNKFRESKEKVVEEGLEAPREEAVVEEVTTEATAAETRKPRHSGRSDKAARGIGRVLGGDLLADGWRLARAAPLGTLPLHAGRGVPEIRQRP